MDSTKATAIDNGEIKEMIFWWEKKRLLYNIVIISFVIFLMWDFWDYPMRMIIGTNQVILTAVFFIIGLNVFYTSGWGLEIASHFLIKRNGFSNVARWVLFIMGTLLSLFGALIYIGLEFDVPFAK